MNSGCAPTQDGRNTQLQGAGIGAVSGMALGGLVAAASGNSKNMGQFIGAGGAIGGMAGYVYGTMVAKRKAKYAKAEDWLDGEIALAKSANESAYAYNATLKSQLEELSQKAATAKTVGDRAGMQAVKTRIAKVALEAERQEKAEQQTVEDQKVVAADAKAQSADNYEQFHTEANNFAAAKAERGKILRRLAALDTSLDR